MPFKAVLTAVLLFELVVGLVLFVLLGVDFTGP